MEVQVHDVEVHAHDVEVRFPDAQVPVRAVELLENDVSGLPSNGDEPFPRVDGHAHVPGER